MEKSAGSVRQLGTPTGCDGRGRIQPVLDGDRSLCISPVLPDPEVSDEGSEGSGGAHISDPLLAGAAMVPASAGADVRAGSDSPEGSFTAGASESITPPIRVSSVDRLEIVRRQFESKGPSSGVVELLMGGTRDTRLLTSPPGRVGTIGVFEGIPIPCLPL